jgi:hypothetical protein
MDAHPTSKLPGCVAVIVPRSTTLSSIAMLDWEEREDDDNIEGVKIES